MSIFGKLDAAKISSNPYFIEQGEYKAEVIEARFAEKQDGQRQLVITYIITNQESEFFEQRASQYFNLPDADLDDEKLSLLSPEDKQKIRKNNAAIKRALCGDSRFKGLGIPENDLNESDWNPESLKGLKVDLAISNFGQDGYNVRWANIYE